MRRPSQVRTVTGLEDHSERVDAILLCVCVVYVGEVRIICGYL